jgi:hypothetical protein
VPSIAEWRRLTASLPARLDDAALALVEAVASAPLAPLPPCDGAYFQNCLRSLSILPRRGDDEVTGELRVSLYQRHLRHLPRAAMTYLVDQALIRCSFFPSIRECQEIAAEWVRPEGKVRIGAERLARREREARFDELMTRIGRGDIDQAEIDALPERTRMIAAERCLLLRGDDGAYRLRPDRLATGEPMESPEAVHDALADRFPSRRDAA